MLLEPSNQKLHAVQSNSAAAPRCKNLTKRLARLRTRPAVSGLFRGARKRSKKVPLPVPSSHGGGDGSSGADSAGTDTDSTDTEASECSEKEKAFFEDLRRVRRGELTSKARVDLPRSCRSSISRVLGLLRRKGGAFSTLLRRAKARVHHCAVRKEVEEGQRYKGAEEAEWDRGVGLCERRVLVGRRSKRLQEASDHGFFMETSTAMEACPLPN